MERERKKHVEGTVRGQSAADSSKLGSSSRPPRGMWFLQRTGLPTEMLPRWVEQQGHPFEKNNGQLFSVFWKQQSPPSLLSISKKEDPIHTWGTVH